MDTPRENQAGLTSLRVGETFAMALWFMRRFKMDLLRFFVPLVAFGMGAFMFLHWQVGGFARLSRMLTGYSGVEQFVIMSTGIMVGIIAGAPLAVIGFATSLQLVLAQANASPCGVSVALRRSFKAPVALLLSYLTWQMGTLLVAIVTHIVSVLAVYCLFAAAPLSPADRARIHLRPV
jgi:ABC-type antimicrobial peptide transport system permease subunit